MIRLSVISLHIGLIDTVAYHFVGFHFSHQVPDGFTAVMSANKWEHRKADNTFLFTMDHPIPAYLVALAVGDLESAKVGPRYELIS